jgi:putative flippase GtrA
MTVAPGEEGRAGLAAAVHSTSTAPQRPGRAAGVLNHQVFRFAVVGVFNTVFSFGVFAGMQLTIGGSSHYLFVLAASHVVGVLEAYVLQRWLVFRVRGRWWRDLARFWSVYLVALGINFVTLPLLVEVLHVPVLPAQAGVMLATALGTFVTHRRFTFHRPTRAVEPLGSTSTSIEGAAARFSDLDGAALPERRSADGGGSTGGRTALPMSIDSTESTNTKGRQR